MVRIGHLVTGPEPDSAVDWNRPDSGHLNPEVMDHLDYFIAELAKNGIYSRPTMLWYRKLKKGDGVDAFDDRSLRCPARPKMKTTRRIAVLNSAASPSSIPR